MNGSIPKLAKVDKVAALLKMSPRSVYDHIKSGAIPAVRIGPRAIRVDLDELRRALPRVSTLVVGEASEAR